MTAAPLIDMERDARKAVYLTCYQSNAQTLGAVVNKIVMQRGLGAIKAFGKVWQVVEVACTTTTLYWHSTTVPGVQYSQHSSPALFGGNLPEAMGSASLWFLSVAPLKILASLSQMLAGLRPRCLGFKPWRLAAVV